MCRTKTDSVHSPKYFHPKCARNKGIQGTVFIQFLINKVGNITKVEILRDIGGGEEAKRVVENMPQWNPEKQGGLSTKVQFYLPIL